MYIVGVYGPALQLQRACTSDRKIIEKNKRGTGVSFTMPHWQALCIAFGEEKSKYESESKSNRPGLDTRGQTGVVRMNPHLTLSFLF